MTDEPDPRPLRTFEEYRQAYFPSLVERQAEPVERPHEFGTRLAHESLAAPK